MYGLSKSIDWMTSENESLRCILNYYGMLQHVVNGSGFVQVAIICSLLVFFFSCLLLLFHFSPSFSLIFPILLLAVRNLM